ncbi:MAG: D-sedoheptulose-7-phosphate isomerase [Pseudomonadota bacterium]
MDIPLDRITDYFATLHRCLEETAASDGAGRPIGIEVAFSHFAGAARTAHGRGNKLMFVGNGGSAGIASHLAIDYSKNGGLRALAFNDGAALTCLGNDLGYESVFAKQIEFHARPGDMLIAISSSGRSANILRAVEAARAKDCFVATLSGFSADNPLRRMGDLNFHVGAAEYGFVEVSHLALCHAVLDLGQRRTKGVDGR